MVRFGLAIFISAFLLFGVQPMIGKYILPWFGGGPSVWTTCLLFFQVLLLAGYTYAHLLSSRLPLRKQVIVHVGLILLTLVLLPIGPGDEWKPDPAQSPTWQILLLLLVNVGGPYLMLSSTGPLMQRWFSLVMPDRSPYRLYALSNLGSLLALVTYPFVVEPLLAVGDQTGGWSWTYGLFALLAVGCAWSVWSIGREPGAVPVVEAPIGAPPVPENPGPQAANARSQKAPPPDGATLGMWLGLAACGTALLMATTNQLCQEVAVVPFLWVLPLTLYLLSFIICFDSPRWYHRGVFGVVLAGSAAWACWVLFQELDAPLWMQISAFSTVMFAGCMTCHGELVRSKPDPQHLTLFYLMVSAGGALGGVAVALVAPQVFNGFWEFHLALAAACVLTVIAWNRANAWPASLPQPVILQGPLTIALMALVFALTYQASSEHDDGELIYSARNFYGVLHVFEDMDYDVERQYLKLTHGRILHGIQYIEEPYRSWATTYYGPGTGGYLSVEYHPRRFNEDPQHQSLHIGVIGLGTGTMAANAREGDRVRFYDINPQVIEIAKEYFSYLEDSKAQIDIVLGDARIMLERELDDPNVGSQQFDVLIIDAFSSDAIPIHLLTAECGELYRQHLKPDGLLMLHISNRYLDLNPVARGLAEHLEVEAVRLDNRDDDELGVFNATWIALTNNRRFIEHEAVQLIVDPWTNDDRPPLLWTDDFAALWQVID